MISGRFQPGDRLPSENELSSSHHVSRHTVRKALSILEQEGFIEAEHGRGTFVSRKPGRGKPLSPALGGTYRKGSGNIAVITTYLSDYIFPRLIQGIDSVLTAEGYSIILKNTGNSRVKMCIRDSLPYHYYLCDFKQTGAAEPDCRFRKGVGAKNGKSLF